MSDLIKLGEIAQDTFKNLQLERLYKKLSERAKEIKDAPEYQQMDFYCDECGKDFGGVGQKKSAYQKDQCSLRSIELSALTDTWQHEE